MYINDVHIICYIIAILFGSITGRAVEWTKDRLPEYKKVITLEYLKKRRKITKLSIILMIINSVLNVLILYRYGIQKEFIENLELIKYLILVPMLLSVFVIDYSHKIIPNRLNLTILEIRNSNCIYIWNIKCSNNYKYVVRNACWRRSIFSNNISC